MAPAATWFWDDWQTIAALVIFAGTYFVIAVGKLPGYRLDRAGAALLGAALMVGCGVRFALARPGHVLPEQHD
jgi:hypothetical protein